MARLSFRLSACFFSVHQVWRFINAGDLPSHTSFMYPNLRAFALAVLPTSGSQPHPCLHTAGAVTPGNTAHVSPPQRSLPGFPDYIDSPSRSFLRQIFFQGSYSLTLCRSVYLFFLVFVSSHTANGTKVGAVSPLFMLLPPVSGPGSTVNPTESE